MSDKNDLAQERTDWAEDRTNLANERTFAGWMRTGMASVGVAIGLKAVFGATEPTWLAKGVASVFLAAALFMFWAARQQACATHNRLQEQDAKTQSDRNFNVIVAAMTCGTIMTGIILWLI